MKPAGTFSGCGDGTFVPMSGAFEEPSEIYVMDRIYILRRHKRQQCKCTSCGKIIAAKGPLKLKPGAEFSVQMEVQLVDDKFHRHIPLNRQAEMMSERGLQVGTKTLYSLSDHLSTSRFMTLGLASDQKTQIAVKVYARLWEWFMQILGFDCFDHPNFKRFVIAIKPVWIQASSHEIFSGKGFQD
jgi:hypothetical protein